MSIYCKYCNHHWKVKKEYDKHISCCQYFYHLRRNPESKMDDNGIKLPSHKELFRFVQELSLKCERLEKEMTKLKNNMNTKQKRVISEWLNQSIHIPCITFEEWAKNIAVGESQLKIVFKRDLTEGIKDSIAHHMKSKMQNAPLRAFTQKQNAFYIYTRGIWSNGEQTEEPKWKMMTPYEFENFIIMLSQAFLREFIKWQKINVDENEENEKKKEEEMMYLIKINGGLRSSSDKRIGDLKKWLFTKIEENIQQIEYE